MDEITPDSLCELAEHIIVKAKKMGATAAEISANTDSEFAVSVRKNNVENIEQGKNRNIDVTVYFGTKSGSANTSDFNSSAINTIIEKASHIAKFTEDDPYNGLAEEELMAYNYPDLQLYHPWDIETQEAIRIAKDCESIGLSSNKKITNSEGATISAYSNLGIYANSHGFSGTVQSTKHSISCSFIAEHNKEMQRDHYYTIARDPNDLDIPEKVSLKAAKKTVDRLGAKKIITQRCPVIFSAEVAPSIIGSLIQAINGSNVYRKSTFLLDHLQKQVFASQIHIEENPFIPKALGSTPFDAEGVRSSKSNLITSGILQRYVLDSYSARKLNMRTTGNSGGVHNLIVKTGSFGLNELLKKMGRGLLVTELMGGNTNIVTGDYSRGAFGYWIENGEIQYPVTGITIAANLKNIFLGIQEISNDIDYRSNILTGSILVDNMTIAGA